MEMQNNSTLSESVCLDKDIDTAEAVHNESLIDVNKAFGMLMLCQKPSRFFTEHTGLSVNQNALKANFIDLLHKEGLISKEIYYTTKRLMKEAEDSGVIE